MSIQLLAAVIMGRRGAVAVNLPASVSSNASAVDPSNATANITIKRDGRISYVDSGVNYVDWVTPKYATVGDGYEVMFHQDSGDAVSGVALDTWLALSTDRGCSLTTSGVGILTASVTLSIRPTGGATLDTSALSLVAEQSV